MYATHAASHVNVEPDDFKNILHVELVQDATVPLKVKPMHVELALHAVFAVETVYGPVVISKPAERYPA